MCKVYLAGGFKSNWQKIVKDSVVMGVEYLDPREKELLAPWNVEKSSVWDKHKIRECDIVFAYMERTNPSGFGLAAEIGYAHGLGKTVILVLEKNHSVHKDHYLEFLTKMADITFDTLDDGLTFLSTFR
jgi:nucleoside 2-deoxyribosyltransferase